MKEAKTKVILLDSNDIVTASPSEYYRLANYTDSTWNNLTFINTGDGVDYAYRLGDAKDIFSNAKFYDSNGDEYNSNNWGYAVYKYDQHAIGWTSKSNAPDGLYKFVPSTGAGIPDKFIYVSN